MKLILLKNTGTAHGDLGYEIAFFSSTHLEIFINEIHIDPYCCLAPFRCSDN